MEQSQLNEVRSEIEHVLSEWRKRTLTHIYRGCTIIGIAGLIFVGASDGFLHPDQYLTMAVYLLLYLVIVVSAFRPGENHNLRAWIFISVIYFIGVISLARGGLSGVGRLFLLSLPVLAMILINLRATAIVSGALVSTLLTFTWLADKGVLEPFFYWPLADNPFSTTNWFVETLYTLLVLGIILLLLTPFYRFLIQTIEVERRMNREVSQSRSLISQYNITLEEKVNQRTAELAAAMHEAQDARIAAETASRAKSAFLATMSHEIRTPLNAIIGMTNLLIDTSLNQKQSEFASTVRTSGETLLSLINDILDFSKIEAGRMELEESPFPLRQCIESAIDLVNARASEKSVEIIYMLDPNVPQAILGDENRLRQILTNLLSNAVKFTEEGEIEISVTAKAAEKQAAPESSESPNRLKIVFSIRDTGIGIPTESMKYLFQPFSQGDASTTRRYGGTGLGLVITKRLVEMMNGKIWVESQEGKGSIFYFTIEAVPTISPRRKPRLEARLDLRDKRILIVDDNATNRRILALQFQAWSMHPRATASPKEALQWLQQGECFDAAVIDMEMAEMDGVTLAKEVQRLCQAKPLPMIMLSSLLKEENNEDSALFSEVLTKPIKASNLYNALIAIFAGEVEAILRQKTIELPIFDVEMGKRHPLRILVAEDNIINQNLAILMLERMGYRADVAANGLEAVNALRRQPYDAVLMDIQMPELDGLEATRHIRQEISPEDQPRIIAMTANAMSGDREICLESGMDDYISKPIHIEELVSCLNRCLPRGIREQGMGTMYRVDSAPSNRETETLSGSSFSEKSIDVDELLRLKESLGPNSEVLLPSLVYSFFAQAEKLLAEMRATLQAGEAAGLRRAAHTLKSNSASFGGVRLAEILRRVEENAREGIHGGEESLILLCEQEFSRMRPDLLAAMQIVLTHAEGESSDG
jgi:signal transduction histidine kinase/DNA-binding response OmpR family regulator